MVVEGPRGGGDVELISCELGARMCACVCACVRVCAPIVSMCTAGVSLPFTFGFRVFISCCNWRVVFFVVCLILKLFIGGIRYSFF